MTKQSVEQSALEFAERRQDSDNLKMRDQAGKILLHELGTLMARGLVAGITDQADGVTTYSLTDAGLRRLLSLREDAQVMQMTPAGQNQLDAMLRQLKDINTHMIEMNIWLGRLVDAAQSEADGQARQARAQGTRAKARGAVGSGDGSAAADQ